jgi:hypothetical protein
MAPSNPSNPQSDRNTKTKNEEPSASPKRTKMKKKNKRDNKKKSSDTRSRQRSRRGDNPIKKGKVSLTKKSSIHQSCITWEIDQHNERDPIVNSTRYPLEEKEDEKTVTS